MTYQIKSTPYFQRMLSTSKKNGQLQKLKEEYERVKDFNEKAIEMKMRQVRLKRLFQEIENINETNTKKRRLLSQDKTITKVGATEKRLENLLKAKEIGQYYSRRNSEGVTDTKPIQPMNESLKISLLTKKQLRDREREREELIKAQVNRRNNYGNQISNWNMQKMLMGKLRTEVEQGMKTVTILHKTDVNKSWRLQGSQTTSETSLEDSEKLKNRIIYGNTISERNMKVMSKRKRRSNKSSSCKEIETNPYTESSKTILKASFKTEPGIMDDQPYQNCVDVQHFEMLSKQCPLYVPDDGKALVKSQEAQKRWAKRSLLKCRFKSDTANVNLASAEKFLKQNFQNHLRSISNDTNILQIDFINEQINQLDRSENEDSGEFSKNEILICSEYLCDANVSSNSCTRTVELGLKPLHLVADTRPTNRSTTLMIEKGLSLKPVLKVPISVVTNEEEVQNLIKNYEPYSMKVVQKEIVEMGVQKLRDIFEHQNA